MILDQLFDLLLYGSVDLSLYFLGCHLLFDSSGDCGGLFRRYETSLHRLGVLLRCHILPGRLQYSRQHLILNSRFHSGSHLISVFFHLGPYCRFHLGLSGRTQGFGVQLEQHRIQHFSVVFRCQFGNFDSSSVQAGSGKLCIGREKDRCKNRLCSVIQRFIIGNDGRKARIKGCSASFRIRRSGGQRQSPGSQFCCAGV